MRLMSAVAVFVFLITGVVVATILIQPWIIWGLIVVIGLMVYDVADALAVYKKQRYEFRANTVFYDTGTLFTDRNTELGFSNITHVRVKKPFIEYHLFGTGKIVIESAGSKDATVEMKAIKRPYEAFDQIRQLLAKDTFSLTYDHLLSQKKPSPLAVVLGLIGGFIVAIGFIVLNIGLGVVVSFVTEVSFGLVLLVAGGLVVVGLFYLYATYQDQLRRTYYVYEDVIHYSKGFLTKQEAFMPATNLANTRLTQNFLGKLLNLQDVIVSCQGQGSEINFANLRNGEDMQRAINRLINNRPDLKPQVATTAAATDRRLVDKFTAAPTPQSEDVTARDFSMHLMRALASLLPLAIFPPALAVAVVIQAIVVRRTVFRLTDGGVASYYTFLTTKNVEFSRDKITGLVIKRSPFDRYFNTCTVSFWSIGSGAAVDFKHIPYDESLEELMRTKAGIVADEELEVIKPQFSVLNFSKANLGNFGVGLMVLVVSLIPAKLVSLWFGVVALAVAIGAVVWFVILKRRYARAGLRLGQHTTSLRIGVWFNKQFYARNDNIKDITLTKYPLSSLGKVQFNVAGERLIDDNKTSLPNQFSIDYIPGVADEVSGDRVWLDKVLLLKPTPKDYGQLSSQSDSAQKMIRLSRPSLKNSLVSYTLWHLLLLPLIVILPLTLALRYYWLRRVEYRLESDRVVKRWGLVYRKQHSILLERLDYTETGQGLLGKIFKNGNLYFYTTGSGKTELTLHDMDDYQQFYQDLRRP